MSVGKQVVWPGSCGVQYSDSWWPVCALGGEGFPTSHKIQEGFTLVVTVELELMTGSE